MRIREENRNMFLLATVTLCCGAVAATSALFEPVIGSPADQLVAEQTVNSTPQTPDLTPVRVVGAPFEPNVNPRER